MRALRPMTAGPTAIGEGHVERPDASGNGCGASLWDGVGGRARADWGKGAGGSPAVPGDTVGGTSGLGLELGLRLGEVGSGISSSK
jgi:hypothetical protein